MAADITSLVAQNAFDVLDAPIRTVTPPHSPVPFAAVLEDLYVPTPARIVAAAREAVGLVAAGT